MRPIIKSFLMLALAGICTMALVGCEPVITGCNTFTYRGQSFDGPCEPVPGSDFGGQCPYFARMWSSAFPDICFIIQCSGCCISSLEVSDDLSWLDDKGTDELIDGAEATESGGSEGGVVFSGKVANTNGQGVPDVTVTLIQILSDAIQKKAGMATTNEDGEFVMENTPPGTYLLKATYGGVAATLHEGIEIESGVDVIGYVVLMY